MSGLGTPHAATTPYAAEIEAALRTALELHVAVLNGIYAAVHDTAHGNCSACQVMRTLLKDYVGR